MKQTNFLIGRGELLTHDIKGLRKSFDKSEVYTLRQSQDRLSSQIAEMATVLDELPSQACPHDFAVSRLIINPSYLARSFFPSDFLRAVGLQSVGSRKVTIKPEQWKRKGRPTECSTTEIFVAGKRQAFRSLNSIVMDFEEGSDEAIGFSRIESIQAFQPDHRIVGLTDKDNRYFEVGVHLLDNEPAALVTSAFIKFAKRLEFTVHTELSFQAGQLWFVPVVGRYKDIKALAEFTLVRVIRKVPEMRGLLPSIARNGPTIDCQLPSQDPLSSEPRVAILDGGLPSSHPISRWVRDYRVMDPAAEDERGGTDHGLAVTSAFLFGSIEPESLASRPYSYVDHIRVLDKESRSEDPLTLYRTLGHIEEVLLSRQYEFINLSLGPDISVEDEEVHAWTSVIDDLLSDGETFMTVAAGNNGQRDKVLGFDRVQVPADCVNVVAVGAATSCSDKWERAKYSARGPGRSPGFMKPDLMSFGGSSKEYFHALVSAVQPELTPLQGSSFSAPNVLRSAVGVRAVLGTDLSPLAIKALLIDSADTNGHDSVDVGWGKVPDELMSIISCPDGVARIVYQGELKPGKYLRAPLPLPNGGLTGMVTIKATFAFASLTDPQDSASYTKAGLEVTFRPDERKISEGKAHPKSKSFFKRNKFATEAELRSDAGKWETVLHDKSRMRATSLKSPTFDIHYNARDGGGNARRAEKIKYALIISVEAPKHPNLYSDILQSFSKVLTPIQPQVSLPVRV